MKRFRKWIVLHWRLSRCSTDAERKHVRRSVGSSFRTYKGRKPKQGATQ